MSASLSLPDWFELRVGFVWLIDDDVCVLLGWEPEGRVFGDPVAIIGLGDLPPMASYQFKPRFAFTRWHRNTWYVESWDDARANAWMNNWRPLPPDYPHARALMARATNKHGVYATTTSE